MSAQISVTFTREVRRYGSNDGWNFFVYNPHSRFAGGEFDRSAWEYLGHAGLYYPEMDGDHFPYIVSPNYLPGQIMYPQSHVSSLTEVNRYFQAHGEAFLALAAVEAEREEWFGVMAAAEAAEARARSILSDSPAIPPF
jgi:hypothetical protein